MKTKQELFKTVQDFFKREQLLMEINPLDDKMVTWFFEECLKKLPNLYRELEEKKMLPDNASYHAFLEVFKFELENKRMEHIMRALHGV